MLTVIIIFTLPYWTGKIRSKFDLIPPWSIYRSVIGCGFLLSLSSLITAGIPTPEAIRIISRNASPWQEESVEFISNQMNILKNAAILIMGGVFMWIVSGMFSLQQQISNAAQFN